MKNKIKLFVAVLCTMSLLSACVPDDPFEEIDVAPVEVASENTNGSNTGGGSDQDPPPLTDE